MRDHNDAPHSWYQGQVDSISNHLGNVWVFPFPGYSFLNKWLYISLGKNWTYHFYVYMPRYWCVLHSGNLTSFAVDGFHVQTLAMNWTQSKWSWTSFRSNCHWPPNIPPCFVLFCFYWYILSHILTACWPILPVVIMYSMTYLHKYLWGNPPCQATLTFPPSRFWQISAITFTLLLYEPIISTAITEGSSVTVSPALAHRSNYHWHT